MSTTTDYAALLRTWGDNFTRNTSEAFANLRAQDYVRLIVIIGGYCLLRPYIMKLGAKMQTRAHEKDSAEGGESAEVHPNELRGKIAIPGVDESEDEEDESAPGDWGRAARLRQRKFIREALEREEARLRDEAEAESDKEIAEFLVD